MALPAGLIARALVEQVYKLVMFIVCHLFRASVLLTAIALAQQNPLLLKPVMLEPLVLATTGSRVQAGLSVLLPTTVVLELEADLFIV